MIPPVVRDSEYVKHAHHLLSWVLECPRLAPRQAPRPPHPPHGPCPWLCDPHSRNRAKRRGASTSLGHTAPGDWHEVPEGTAPGPIYRWPQLLGVPETLTPTPGAQRPAASGITHKTRNETEGYGSQRPWRGHLSPGLGTPVWEGPRLGTSPSRTQKFPSFGVMSLQVTQLLTILQFGVPITQ